MKQLHTASLNWIEMFTEENRAFQVSKSCYDPNFPVEHKLAIFGQIIYPETGSHFPVAPVPAGSSFRVSDSRRLGRKQQAAGLEFPLNLSSQSLLFSLSLNSSLYSFPSTELSTSLQTSAKIPFSLTPCLLPSLPRASLPFSA